MHRVSNTADFAGDDCNSNEGAEDLLLRAIAAADCRAAILEAVDVAALMLISVKGFVPLHLVSFDNPDGHSWTASIPIVTGIASGATLAGGV